MTDRTTTPHAAFELSHTWATGPAHMTETVGRIRRDLPQVANALDMLRVCGPTFASVRAVVDAWTEAGRPFDGSDRAQWEDEERLRAEWPELTETLDDLVHASRAGRPTQP